MADTRKVQDVQVEGVQPNILVDLDKTLAFHPDNFDVSKVGKPIPAMVERIKAWRAQHIDVRIFTARWSDVANRPITKKIIDQFCMEQFGETLPITNEKDYGTVLIYDDRARQVEINTGRVVGENG